MERRDGDADLGTGVRFFYGPFSARPPSGPASPPAGLVAAVPHLAEVLTSPDPGLPAVRDWSWRAGEPRAEGSYMSHWVRWGDADAAMLDAVWTSSADATVRSIIERWTWSWPDVAAALVPARHPDVALGLADAARHRPTRQRTGQGPSTPWVDTALTVGLHERYRQLVTWPDPKAQVCAVCGRAFAPETLSGWMRRYGPPRYCPACCCRAINSHDRAVTTAVATAAVTALVAELGFIPGQDGARNADLDGINDADQRDRAMAAIVALPAVDRLVHALAVEGGRGRWLRVLQAAGVVGDAWRPSRGTFCFAADGHPCRSLAERSVDDWLHARGIPHEVEPAWPVHAELNPNGKLRADWALNDGTFIELAGMLADDGYATRMTNKAALAAEAGIRLVVVTPADLGRLELLLP